MASPIVNTGATAGNLAGWNTDTPPKLVDSGYSPSTVGGAGAPAAHHASHQNGGSDEVATATAAANAIPKAGSGGTLAVGWIPDLSATYQPKDATLTAFAAYNTNGIVTQTAADTFVGRTVTGTTDKITVTNGDGVSGNPTLTIASTYAGQTSIVTIGTVTAGTWHATIIEKAYGGTGEDNSTGGTANTFWARPNGSTGAAAYRVIAVADLPDLSGLANVTTLADADEFVVNVSSVNKNITTVNLTKQIVPPGTVAALACSTVPGGYLECDGSAVSRTTYANLFAAIGTTWGAGDASTTFNLPDIRGRTIIGVGSGSGLTSRSLAASGGEETHQITAAEMPSHTHSPSSGTAFWAFSSGAGANTIGGGTNTIGNSATASAGADGTHNTMPPYKALKWIIKT